jgi:ribA/ribD-fused uncharacterized protein
MPDPLRMSTVHRILTRGIDALGEVPVISAAPISAMLTDGTITAEEIARTWELEAHRSMVRKGAAVISRFAGEYAFLSNFAPSPIALDGVVYPTVEHAFQALKTLDPGERARVAALATPARAKRASREVTLRPDWEQVKVAVMEDLVRRKFADPALAARLLATGEQELVEGNAWNDRFWGVCRGSGRNELGKILMWVRADLKGGAPGPPDDPALRS